MAQVPRSFFNLPIEVRLTIYSLVFAGSIGFVQALSPANYYALERDGYLATEHSILLTCQKCHNEAIRLYLQLSTWIFDDWLETCDFFQHIALSGNLSGEQLIGLHMAWNPTGNRGVTPWYLDLRRRSASEQSRITSPNVHGRNFICKLWPSQENSTFTYFKGGGTMDFRKEPICGPGDFCIFIEKEVMPCASDESRYLVHIEVRDALPRT